VGTADGDASHLAVDVMNQWNEERATTSVLDVRQNGRDFPTD
jgi:hypothetical protein